LVRKLANENQKFRRCLLMGIRITEDGSDKVKKLISEIAAQAINNGEHPLQ